MYVFIGKQGAKIKKDCSLAVFFDKKGIVTSWSYALAV